MDMKIIKPACVVCMYFERIEITDRGLCRFALPRPNMALPTFHPKWGIGVWPLVELTDWCSHFKPEVREFSSEFSSFLDFLDACEEEVIERVQQINQPLKGEPTATK